MTDDILSKAKKLLGLDYQKRALPSSAESLTIARELLSSKGGSLDVYIVFDTTGSMNPYVNVVRDNIAQVTDALLGESDIRLSINGVGDHGDRDSEGREMSLQMYVLSKDPKQVHGSIKEIMMTDGGDVPEAYECLALALAKRLPVESAGRKRAVVLVGDSIPHGMTDENCPNNVDHMTAFEAMKTVCDGFYFVGCNSSMYDLQRQLVNKNRKEREQFIPLGNMVDVLPTLLIALAKKAESERAFAEYMKIVGTQDPAIAGKVYGLLTPKNEP